MRRPVLLLVVLASLAACSGGGGAAAPPSGASTTTLAALETVPSTSPETGPPEPDAVTPEGFERVQATVTEPDGTVCELCLWLADDGDRRSQGLMSVTDLGAADGMAFVYQSPHSGNFWMKDTLLPLSIAFFGVDGTYLDAFDMEPCAEEPCDLYPTPDDFVVAIETTQGDLANLGIGAGSVLELSDLPCD
jgi:uncharacterized membrane protein (UPF0127 family)